MVQEWGSHVCEMGRIAIDGGANCLVYLTDTSSELTLLLFSATPVGPDLTSCNMDPKITGSEYVQETKASDADAEPTKRHSITGDAFVHDHGADTELRRILSTRHLTMIALGSSIGMGLWLGSGSSLINGGPAGIFLGYCLSGAMIWSVAHSIGEMAVMYPLPSAFVQWTGKFIDPSAAFALGWAYYFSFAITGESRNSILSYYVSRVFPIYSGNSSGNCQRPYRPG